jgi:hypothetical protein
VTGARGDSGFRRRRPDDVTLLVCELAVVEARRDVGCRGGENDRRGRRVFGDEDKAGGV